MIEEINVEGIVKNLQNNMIYITDKLSQMESRFGSQARIVDQILKKKEVELSSFGAQERLDENMQHATKASYKLRNLETEIEILQQKDAENEKNYQEEVLKSETLQSKIDQLNSNNQFLYSENKRLTEKNLHLTNQIELLKKEISPKTALIQKLERENGSLSNQVEILSNEKNEFLKRLKMSETSLQSFKSNDDNIQKKLQAMKKDIINKEQTISALESENYQLRQDISKYEQTKLKGRKKEDSSKYNTNEALPFNNYLTKVNSSKENLNEEMINKANSDDLALNFGNYNSNNFHDQMNRGNIFSNQERAPADSPRTAKRNEYTNLERKLSNLLEILNPIESAYEKMSYKQKSQEGKQTLKELEEKREGLKKEINEIRIKLRELHNFK